MVCGNCRREVLILHDVQQILVSLLARRVLSVLTRSKSSMRSLFWVSRSSINLLLVSHYNSFHLEYHFFLVVMSWIVILDRRNVVTLMQELDFVVFCLVILLIISQESLMFSISIGIFESLQIIPVVKYFPHSLYIRPLCPRQQGGCGLSPVSNPNAQSVTNL